jgi:hypothetical protein
MRIGVAGEIFRMTGKSCVAIGLSMAAAILLFGPYTNYSPPAVDMWFPTGFFTNFSDMVERFGLTYYQASRLPYVLPGVAIYAIFTPKAANFLLNLASFGTSVSALLVIASRQLDRRWSLALTCLFAFNSYLLHANLWDYSDGPAIAYFLAGYAIVASASQRDSHGTLLLAGACWTSALLTNLVSAILIAPFAFQVLLVPRCTLPVAIRRCVWMAAGALLVFLPLAAISRYLFGLWFFPAPQIDQLLHAAADPDFLPGLWGTGTGWLANAYRIAALYGPLIAAIPCLLDRRMRTPSFVTTFAVCATGGLLYLGAELDGKALLRSAYHGTFLLVFSFIQTVALVRAATESESDAKDELLGPRLLIGLAVMISLVFFRVHDLNIATWPVLGVCVVIIAITILRQRSFSYRSSTFAVALAFLLNVSTAADGQVRWIYDDLKGLYTAAMQAQAVLTSGILHGEKIRFWHDRDDPQADLFLAINALYMWNYHDLTNELPKLGKSEVSTIVPADTVLVHLCTDICPLEERNSLLDAAGLAVASTYSWKIVPEEGSPFSIVVQKVRAAQADKTTLLFNERAPAQTPR